MISRMVADAREAVVVAAEELSDQEERDQSVALSRRAFEQYDEQLEVLKKAGKSTEREEFEKSVGKEVAVLKEELYASRKPRAYMAVTGWF